MPITLNELIEQARGKWKLEKLCKDLSSAKQIYSNSSRKLTISQRENECLCGLLCNLSPQKIAEIIGMAVNALQVTYLTNRLYPYIKELYRKEKNGEEANVQWHNIPRLLEELGYKKSNGELLTKEEIDVRWRILIDLPQIDDSKLEVIMGVLKELQGHASVSLQQIQPGSVVLILLGSQEGFEWTRAFFRAGLLTEMLGVPVLDVRLESQAEENLAPVTATIAPAYLETQRNWLESLYQPDWEPVERILAPAAHRGDRSTAAPEAIADLIPLLRSENSESTRRRAAAALGDIGVGNREAIAALTELLETTQDEETLWQGAIALGKIDPDNPKAAVRRAKRFHLEVQPEPLAIALVVVARPNADGRISIRLGVEPVDAEAALPGNLKLAVLHKSGDAFIEARSAGTDKYLQRSFRASVGKEFTVRLSLGDVSVAEDFVI